MRRPRVRITVGTLLFVVLLVAWDCWYFRPSYERGWWRVTPDSGYEELPARVGALPLIDVVLLGLWGLAVRRLRTKVRGPEPGTRPSPPAFTFFSLSLLVLGGLGSLFMPETVCWVEEVLDVAMLCVAAGWDAAFGDPGETIPWIISETVFLEIFVSGPPLFLAWIGRILANRYAAGVSPRRFRVMTGLVSLGFAGVGLAICVTPQPFWEEEEAIPLHFQILDEASGRPIAQAFVRISDPFSHDPASPSPSAFTDSDGRVRLTGHFEAQGVRNAFWTMGDFAPWGRWLEVSAPGHRRRRIPLTDILGPAAASLRPDLRKVALARGETPADSCRDLAGLYFLTGAGGNVSCWFRIEPDGRFAWCWTGCVRPGTQEYGYLKRIGETIQCLPLPHPEREIYSEATLRYRAIEWGERHYLSATDNRSLDRFCRSALALDRSSDSVSTDRSYLRASDLEKPQEGLPRLPPEVWATFLVDEVRLGNREGTLRRVLDPLNPWKHRYTLPFDE